MSEAYVIKRGTHDTEAFDPLKLHQSVVAACLSVRAFEGEAHVTAERVCRHVINWLLSKTEVTSADIRRVASTYLQRYHPEAAYLYEHHQLVA
jgi:hypothetical protein